ncbi:MAG: signal peptidase I [Patescibacteria group bacterium]
MPTGAKDDKENSGEEAGDEAQGLVAKAVEFVAELVHIVVISLAIIVPIRYFLIQPFYVKGASMEPNFYDHEYLIIDELSYRFRPPARGDIVVFRYPLDPSQFFIKRIIGFPGERIRVENGKVSITPSGASQEIMLDESAYLGTVFSPGDKELTLGANEYFVMGDNRSASMDSRSFGPVSRSAIVGRVWVRGWPPEKITVFSAPKLQAKAF